MRFLKKRISSHVEPATASQTRIWPHRKFVMGRWARTLTARALFARRLPVSLRGRAQPAKLQGPHARTSLKSLRVGFETHEARAIQHTRVMGKQSLRGSQFRIMT